MRIGAYQGIQFEVSTQPSSMKITEDINQSLQSPSVIQSTKRDSKRGLLSSRLRCHLPMTVDHPCKLPMKSVWHVSPRRSAYASQTMTYYVGFLWTRGSTIPSTWPHCVGGRTSLWRRRGPFIPVLRIRPKREGFCAYFHLVVFGRDQKFIDRRSS